MHITAPPRHIPGTTTTLFLINQSEFAPAAFIIIMSDGGDWLVVIDYRDSGECDEKGKLQMDPEGVSMVQLVKEAIGVVSVCGRVHEGKRLILNEHPFYERFKMVEEEVIEPRNLEKRLNTHYSYELEPFRVRRKNFWLLSTFDKVLKNFIRDLSHEADGLIYQFQKPLPKPKKNVSYAKEIFSTHQKAVTSNQPIR
ncbi:hypothetical protein ACFE04_018605 [Oxalis oulophora]